MNNKVTGFVLFLACISLSMSVGCSKPRVELAVASQPNVNPDHSSRPSPVIVKVYELRNDLTFKQAEFSTLFDTPLQVLGADLIAADELVFIPGEARRVAYHPNPNTRFVGVVAGFRQMDRALWRIIKPVDPEKANWLSFELNDATILVVPDKDAEDWEPENAIRLYQQQSTKPQQPTPTVTPPLGRPGQPGVMAPANSANPSLTPSAHPAPSPISAPPSDVASRAGAYAGQGAKEAITIIQPTGAAGAPGGTGAGAAPAAPPVQNAPAVSNPSLPTMRQF